MTPDTQAHAFVLALEWNAVSLSEIVSWADERILEEAHPSETLISLSLANNTSVAVSALNQLAANPCLHDSSRIAFKYLLRGLRANLFTYEQISKFLYDLALRQIAPDSTAESYMHSYWDELDLANAGVFGDPSNVKQEILNFLIGYAA